MASETIKKNLHSNGVILDPTFEAAWLEATEHYKQENKNSYARYIKFAVVVEGSSLLLRLESGENSVVKQVPSNASQEERERVDAAFFGSLPNDKCLFFIMALNDPGHEAMTYGPILCLWQPIGASSHAKDTLTHQARQINMLSQLQLSGADRQAFSVDKVADLMDNLADLEDCG